MCQGDVKNTPIELQELYYPLLYDCHAFRADSGGAGKFRGGIGVEVRVTAAARLLPEPQHGQGKVPAVGFARRRGGRGQ